MAVLPLGADEERIEDPRFIITFSPGAHFWSVAVGRLRCDSAQVAETVAEIRALMRTRDRVAAVWSVGRSATPADLPDRLIGLGLEREGTSDVLILTGPPTGGIAPFEVREVRSLEDLHTWIDVSAEAFGWSRDDASDERDRAEDTLRACAGGQTLRLMALDDGRPVAVARASSSPRGYYLGGMATLPSDRRRGAMTTLVAATWDAALRHGTPAVVAYGGSMSAPGFLRLGFAKTGQITHLIDRL